MNYFLPPIVTLVIFSTCFSYFFGISSGLKWSAIVVIASVGSFYLLMGLTGLIALLLATPWTLIFFQRSSMHLQMGDGTWPTAIGISLWIPLGAFPAEWIIRSYFPNLDGSSRWWLFALIVTIWASFTPLFFVFQDPYFSEVLRGKK